MHLWGNLRYLASHGIFIFLTHKTRFPIISLEDELSVSSTENVDLLGCQVYVSSQL